MAKKYDAGRTEILPRGYAQEFSALLQNGVPRWFIRNHVLDELARTSTVYVCRNDSEVGDGWCVRPALAANNQRCYGSVRGKGFPTFIQFALLFDGDECDTTREFQIYYDRRKEEWEERRADKRHLPHR